MAALEYPFFKPDIYLETSFLFSVHGVKKVDYFYKPTVIKPCGLTNIAGTFNNVTSKPIVYSVLTITAIINIALIMTHFVST